MNWRKLSRRLHLWSGLSAGLLLIVTALTGSALVFYIEIDRTLHTEISTYQRDTAPDWDTILSTLRTQYPDKTGSWRLEVTTDQGAIPARYFNPPETEGRNFAPLMVWLSADGSQILRQDFWGDTLMTWLYDLHYQLLLNDTGAQIIGWFGLVASVMLLTGLLAWWPRKGQWLKALRFKRRNSAIGLLYDWHKLLGLLFALPLLLLCLTGTMLALPDETRSVLSMLTGPVQTAGIPKSNATLPVKINPSVAVTTAQAALPQARLAWIETPPAGGGYYRLRVQVPGDPSVRFPRSFIYIDAATAEVLSIVDYRQQGTSDTILNWLHSLHDGIAFGLFGRILWVLAGLACLLLFILGFWRWRLRLSHQSS